MVCISLNINITAGKGEDFIRFVAAYDVSMRMEMGNINISEAMNSTVFIRLSASTGGKCVVFYVWSTVDVTHTELV